MYVVGKRKRFLPPAKDVHRSKIALAGATIAKFLRQHRKIPKPDEITGANGCDGLTVQAILSIMEYDRRLGSEKLKPLFQQDWYKLPADSALYKRVIRTKNRLQRKYAKKAALPANPEDEIAPADYDSSDMDESGRDDDDESAMEEDQEPLPEDAVPVDSPVVAAAIEAQ